MYDGERTKESNGQDNTSVPSVVPSVEEKESGCSEDVAWNAEEGNL